MVCGGPLLLSYIVCLSSFFSDGFLFCGGLALVVAAAGLGFMVTSLQYYISMYKGRSSSSPGSGVDFYHYLFYFMFMLLLVQHYGAAILLCIHQCVAVWMIDSINVDKLDWT